MNIYFGFSAPDRHDQIEGLYYDAPKEFPGFNGLSKSDYVFMFCESKFHLWKALDYDDSKQRMNFIDIFPESSIIGERAAFLTHFKYFELSMDLTIKVLRQIPNKAFFKLKVENDFTEEQLISRDTYNNEDNFRNIYIRNCPEDVEPNSYDIQLYFNNDELKIAPIKNSDESYFNSFKDNLNMFGRGQGKKDKTYQIILDKSKRNNKFNYSSDLNALRIYDAFMVNYKDKSYWYAGTRPGDSNLKNFIEEHYWEGGDVDNATTMKNIKSVKVGHFLIARERGFYGEKGSKTAFVRILAIGSVKSDMKLVNEERRWYRCDVDWTVLKNPKEFNGNAFAKFWTTMDLCKEDDVKNFINNFLNEMDDEDMESSNTNLNDYITLLKNYHNIILHGAPGTGKTYLARQIAASMMFEKTYEALSENEQSQIGFVQFHPSYDYTDFVEGLRPTKTGSFERTNGIFKDFCVNAQDNFIESGKDEKSYTKDVLVRDLFEKFCLDIERQLLEKESVTLYEKSILRIRQVHRQKDGSAYSIRLAKDAESSTQGLKLAIVERDYQNFKDGKIKSYEDVKPTNDSKSPFHGNAIYYFELYKKLAEFEKKEFGNRQKLDQQEKVTRKNFVFIIDEINRGDMSKIFGELFFAIDPSYRGVRGKIKTQYQNLYEDEDEDCFANGFFVPENVYIVGTMNDIDRSVESMDFAMRRRFVFEEVTAEQSAANFNPPLSAKALKRMSNLNNAIWDDKENKGITGLSSAYHIGPAYFKDFKDGDDKDQFWNRRLKSLLTEYLRGSRNASKDIETLKDAFMGE